ncbi:MAG: type II toxin-antitoxin system HicB family antitoxin [Candidatus Buchananbacteria bacterium]|jgi:predicted RNase H-like HicB family nuclease
MKNSLFTVYIEQDEDGVFIGSVPSVPSCYAQGKTQEEMLVNLRDVLKLCLRNIDSKVLEKIRFVGIQNVKVTHA